MINTDISTIRNSQDPDAVCQSALQIANDNDPEALQLLGQKLEDESFLSILDSKDDYQHPPRTLNITGTLETLGGNKSPEAREILIRLTQNSTFLAILSRVEMLILACADIRPAPESVIQFWTREAGHESSSTPLVVEALFINGTEPAMKLFEEMMADTSYPDFDKTFWLKRYAVPHRDDLYFLEAAGRAIKSDTPTPLLFDWVRIVFDYQANWYPPRNIPTPPNPMDIGQKEKEKLLETGEHALTLEGLPLDLKLAIEGRLSMYRSQEKK
ncbi:MAG: hypothetical protein QNK29_16375 [Desulfobacterales bacterium]|nr:hypothetical protein [Desulfobacterales bacterium]MDX2513538.1 hypothetical protein [Desulfobacterales bacterium]